ncbi:putative mucin TcMUCII [Trypanosoma cruzi]|uniref:Mucin TcMUCII, putative n=2 Tax=Trypanosoma cruzi TaxID=5693 RepID=Q4D4B0_TRYCC|nr:mucin TcMUCII, putative [Trypanosoma cruzi]EAN87364.1 mucin TcMUCII, putative [Trypanosoma cruzi]PWV08867.1 putative mucin TcMUCII [Trypanosoma cruzi]PWV08869.1 putative mucin TcMUCII [Trypanosoma cruzi]PWV08871.1 putative mucin TcMUCII [Trypanosoma cruzi]PWV08873.1 putative mucin TcMUCII [Trypanosoma cruzi]|eukprot:XP_809215.1 mucin TcMUCII [Trypanosoma cruzi strain CL Brener]
MMTCRLLCALLVLALCCCPSLWVIGTCEDQDGRGNPSKPEELGLNSNSLNSGTDKVPKPVISSERDRPVRPVSEEGSGVLSTAQGGKIVSAEPGSDGLNTNSAALTHNSDTLVVKGLDNDTEETNTNKDVTEETPNTTTTTTTTTNAPTTTTTTAPEAPSTTNTEAPNTATTRAPSLLHRIDGSLSSSAWVCTPLVLAASALAYTAVG